ncbi:MULTISPECIES: hypothetical protein [Streptomyces]|uniref:Integral membrane protein n=1 Tax=Streptomyces solicathayae TaxID=3081768 RepID=A0ABZ0LZF8_9ACTN|nr:hypothetical protein [Streptomyces sp. HUAS YS2]WOX24750.1 hypothetical protein R2D22_26570 [Streptomyces sp. HUAS YS2]
MSASDQDTTGQDTTTEEAPEERAPAEAAPVDDAPEGAPEDAPEEDAPTGDDADEDASDGLTPRQARRLRIAAASVLLVAMAVVLVVRLASRTSVLVVGVYGLAMILCGVVIELSRNGRTRLGTWLLAGGLLAALVADWLILP